MKKNRFYVLIFAFVISSILQYTSAESVKSVKDGIVLSVTITPEDDKIFVQCQLTNTSEYPICSASFRYRNVFFATLTDPNGDELPHDETWAMYHAQKSSRVYRRPRSMMGFQMNPGESEKFDFYLEDAYPQSSIEKAKNLQISWESRYGGTKKDMDGNPYHFPPEWTTFVTIPLSKHGIGIHSMNTGVEDDNEAETRFDAAHKHATDSRYIDTSVYLICIGTIAIFAALMWVLFRKNHKKQRNGVEMPKE